MPGYANGGGAGFGGGFGYGGGRGRRNRFFQAVPQRRFAPPVFTEQVTDKQVLKNQAETLQAQLDAIQKRLAEME